MTTKPRSRFASTILCLAVILALLPSAAFATSIVYGPTQGKTFSGGWTYHYQAWGRHNQMGYLYADTNGYMKVTNTNCTIPAKTKMAQAAMTIADAGANTWVEWGPASWNAATNAAGSSTVSNMYYKLYPMHTAIVWGTGKACDSSGNSYSFSTPETFLFYMPLANM